MVCELTLREINEVVGGEQTATATSLSQCQGATTAVGAIMGGTFGTLIGFLFGGPLGAIAGGGSAAVVGGAALSSVCGT